MKTILLCISLFLISSLCQAGHNQAENLSLAICKTKLPDLNNSNLLLEMTIEVLSQNNNKPEAKITKDGATYGDVVSISEETIRPNLIPLTGPESEDETDTSDYNLGEQVMAHAMSLENNPIFNNMFSTGITDLKAVRSVTLYTIGKYADDSIGTLVIVKARDRKGNDLGSFLGGFFVTPCD